MRKGVEKVAQDAIGGEKRCRAPEGTHPVGAVESDGFADDRDHAQRFIRVDQDASRGALCDRAVAEQAVWCDFLLERSRPEVRRLQEVHLDGGDSWRTVECCRDAR